MPTDKSGKWIPLKFKYSDNSAPDVKDNSIKTPQDNSSKAPTSGDTVGKNNFLSPNSKQTNNEPSFLSKIFQPALESVSQGSQEFGSGLENLNKAFTGHNVGEGLSNYAEGLGKLLLGATNATIGVPFNYLQKGSNAVADELTKIPALKSINESPVSKIASDVLNRPATYIGKGAAALTGTKEPSETAQNVGNLMLQTLLLGKVMKHPEEFKPLTELSKDRLNELKKGTQNENQNNATSPLSNEQGKSAQTGAEGQTKVGTPLRQSENIQPEQAPQNAKGINSNVAQVGSEGTGVEKLTDTNHLIETPEKKVTINKETNIDQLKKEVGGMGYISDNTDLESLQNKFGNFSLVVKDANGNRAKMNVSDFLKLKDKPGFSDRINSVFVASQDASTLDKPEIQDGFMGGLEKELNKISDVSSKTNEPINIKGLEFEKKSSISNVKQQEFVDTFSNPKVQGLLKDLGIKKVVIEKPGVMSLSEDANIDMKNKTITINADASDITDSVLHELGHQGFENLSENDKNLLFNRVKDRQDLGYSQGETKDLLTERITDNFYKGSNFEDWLNKFHNREAKPGEQIKMQGLGQAKMPEGFINKEGGKGEETTPLFNQKTEDKNQGNIFGDLQSTPIPGLKQFAEQDLSKVSEGIKSGVNYLRKTFLPSSWGKEGKLTAMLSRVRIAELTRAREQTLNAFKQARDYFDKKSNADNLKLIDGAEKGKYEGDPNESKIMQHMQELLNEKYQYILNTYKDGAGSFIENYFPHFWKDPEKAKAAFSDTFKKSNLEGQKGFLKERTIPLTMDGIAKGLEPVSYNPTELFLAKIHEMDKYIMAQDLKGDFKKNGLIKFAKLGDQPSGWKPLDDPMGKVFQYSEKEKGLIYRGNYYMPEKAANIVNNYLSPGLQNNPFFSVLRQSGNLLNQFQLGLSGFHAFFTTQDVMISKMALGIQQFSQGRFGESLKSLADVPLSPVTNFIKGNELMKDYYSKNPIMTKALDNLMRAGGRAKMDSFYYNKAVQGWMKAWRSGNPIGGVLRTPGALIETLAKPLMQDLVPRQKLGVFFDLAENINKEAASKGLDWKKETALLQEAWDSVDNRMGQMTYDNLFWNKALKDLSMGSVRSVGWNIGDLREIGGAPIDLGKQIYGAAKGQGFRVTPKMAYVLALPIISGMTGAITNYLYTGQPPKELKDYYFPRTGKMNADGTPERISIPGYMRDAWAYSIKPTSTIENKLHPFISDVIQMLNNKDYYGYEIVNPDDPLIKKVGEWASYVGKSAMPFSIQGMQKRAEAGEGLGGQLQSFVGMSPAPKYISNTPMQNDIEELYSKQSGQGVKPYSAQESAKVRRDILQAYKNKDNKKAAELIRQALKDKTFTRRQITDMVRSRNVPDDVWMFKGLRKEYKERLAKKMSAEEKKKYGVKENQ